MTSSSVCAVLFCAALWGQSTTAVRFEVASVKPVTPAGAAVRRITGGPGTASPGQIRYEEQSLRNLLFLAFRVQFYQLDPPGWTDGAYFDIVAKVPSGATSDDVRGMLQALLAERFRLKVHHEPRQMAGYIVTGGPQSGKLIASSQADTEAPLRPADGKPRHFALDADGFVVVPPGEANMIVLPPRNGVSRLTGARQPLQVLCGFLSRELQQPVVDRTGLTGIYDFRLAFAPENVLPYAVLPDKAAGESGTIPQASEPVATLVHAVERQLGLKMNRAKLPVDVLVIDHLERTPIEN